MKKMLQYLTIIIYFGCIGFSSCKKEKLDTPIINPSPPSVTAKTKNARIVEYGTDLPLPGVVVNGWTKTGTSFHTVTDFSGAFSFDGNEIGLGTVTKVGYWSGVWNINFDSEAYYLFAPISFFPENASFDYFSGYISPPCDSFVIKLFPKKYITIHLKDSLGLITSGDANIFTSNAMFIQQGIDQTVGDVMGGIRNEQNNWFTQLRPHIDTTFQYPVCGNTLNIFTVGDFYFDSGWYSKYLHTDTVFISNSVNMIWNITY